MANNILSTLAVILVVALLGYGAYMVMEAPEAMDTADKLVEEWNAEEESDINKDIAEKIMAQQREVAKRALYNYAEIDSYYYGVATDKPCAGAIDYFYEVRDFLTEDYMQTMAIASSEDPEEECHGLEDAELMACWREYTEEEVTWNCEEYRAEETEVRAGKTEACDGRVGKAWYRCMAGATRNYDKYVNMLLDDYSLILLAKENDKKSVCAGVQDAHLRNRCETAGPDDDVVGLDLSAEEAENRERYL